MESRGVVARLIEIRGALAVAFPHHDGLFSVPSEDVKMKEILIASRDKQVEVVFGFDSELKLQFVRAARQEPDDEPAAAPEDTNAKQPKKGRAP